MAKILFALLTWIVLFAVSGCASIHEYWVGAPKEARRGPQPLTGSELDERGGSEPFKRGVAAAETDIAQGKLHFRTFGFQVVGYPRPIYESRYDRILDKHGIKFENQGCEFDTTGESLGYNHRIAQEVVRRYGADFWERTDREARR